MSHDAILLNSNLFCIVGKKPIAEASTQQLGRALQVQIPALLIKSAIFVKNEISMPFNVQIFSLPSKSLMKIQ